MFVIQKRSLLHWSLGVVLVLSSCTKKLDVNTQDPNGLGINALSGKDVFAQALLATVTNQVGANLSSFTGDNFDYPIQWMGYLSRNSGYSASGEGAHIEAFQMIYSDANSIWQSLYHNIYDYNFVIGNSTANSILPGAARTMRIYLFEILTDQFGNIPYSQALQPEATTSPAYDDAKAIYKDLVVQIDSALLQINASQPTGDDSSDVMFKGSKPLWLAFANTIKLRLLLRQVPIVYAGSDGYITSELSNSAAMGYLGAGQDATIDPGFIDASQQQSPFWGDFGYEPGSTSGYQNFSYYGANSVILDTLLSTSDPRVGQFFNAVSGGGYLGNALGSPIVGASQIGQGLLQSATMPALLFPASEAFFMQAEAVERGMMSGNAASLFRQGVEESFRYLLVPNYQSAADAFITGSSDPGVNLAVSGNPIATILNQKWVAECCLDPLEAYADYRRTGLPALYSPLASGVPQQRLLYPETEYSLNSTNVNKQNESTQAATAIKLFWAK